MASSKLSALTAITSAGDDDLIYVADTADGGSSYSSKRITRANLFSGIATEAHVATQIANLIDGAPGALDTLNELAAAMADDASFSTTITNLINANETHIDNVATLTGVAKDGVNFGTFTGSTITDNQTLKAILQLLETAVEARATSTTVTEVDGNVDDLISLSGVAENASDLGTFAGTTVADSQTIKQALQTLETAVESKGNATSLTSLTTAVGDLNTLTGVAQNDEDLGTFSGSTIADSQTVKAALQSLETASEAIDAKTVDSGNNVNVLVGTTSAETCPSSGGSDNYLFLVVDKSDGSIKAIDKTFIEAEG